MAIEDVLVDRQAETRTAAFARALDVYAIKPLGQPGDYVVEFDGQAISAIDDLHRLLTEDRVGTPAAMTVLRGVEKLSLTITPADSQRN